MDCQNVVNSLKNANSSVHWLNQGIVQEIRHLVSTMNYYDVRYVKITTNKAAHVIADDARTDMSSFEFWCNIPDKYRKIIRDEWTIGHVIATRRSNRLANRRGTRGEAETSADGERRGKETGRTKRKVKESRNERNLEQEVQRYDGRRGSTSEREIQRCRRETSLERDARRSLERSIVEQRTSEVAKQREKEQTDANQTILRQLEELKASMKNNNKQGGKMKLAEAIEEAERSPFSREILQAPILAKCALPTFSSIFDGTGSTVQHMKAYNLTLMSWAQHQAVLCKYFPSSLTGEASLWFDNLCEGSVTSFAQMQRFFLGNYITSNRAKAGIEHAFNLKKAHGEIL
ncbi:uncharacterized protein LOC113337549 [Papaver somniferum]|uniref:uncharacterized protein LOC113337549 n=1 Tax=Papaver somniferum TaxID=3469 RepID=UPI000E704D6C|nr:uncharacterized protein LOC113337549 [Papaver somniferum]